MNLKNNNLIKNKLKRSEEVIGIWSIIPSPTTVEIMMSANLDFIILDMEHGSYDHHYLENSIRAVEINNKSSIVRIPSINPQLIQSALDLGANGVIIPKIESEQEAKLVVNYSNYFPNGSRGYNPFTRSHKFYSLSKPIKPSNLSCILIETKDSFKNLERICEVKNLDIIYVGTYDLSLNLGFKGNVKDKEFLKIIEKVSKQIVKSGKICGLMISSKEDVRFARNIGAKFLTYMVDSFHIQNFLNESIKKIISK